MALPIRMLLPCPGCGRLHVDHDEWATRLHSSHLCEHCGLIWKPCLLPTVGVTVLCEHQWVQRRWYVGGAQGSVVAWMCVDCGERKDEKPAESWGSFEQMQKRQEARVKIVPLGTVDPPAGYHPAGYRPEGPQVVEYLDEATGTLRARVTQPGKPTVTLEAPFVDDGPVTDEARGDGLAINSTMAANAEPSYHSTPGMGLTDAGRRRLREVVGTVDDNHNQIETKSLSRPVCYGRGFVYHPQARAENDCDSCRFQAMCREVSPRPPGTLAGNPTRNPAENPDGTPGIAPAPASGPG